MISRNSVWVAALVASVLTASPARSEEGHNHGGEAPTASGPALPRFSAVSESFELVGVINGKQLAIYLDRFDDNTPVKGAKLEMEIGGKKVAVAPHADGEYEATLAEELKPGVVPVTVTVAAGNETDLLAGELDIHEDAHIDEVAGGWKKYAAWALAAAAAAGALLWGAWRLSARRSRLGGAA